MLRCLYNLWFTKMNKHKPNMRVHEKAKYESLKKTK
jgi:hypothetical protein